MRMECNMDQVNNLHVVKLISMAVCTVDPVRNLGHFVWCPQSEPRHRSPAAVRSLLVQEKNRPRSSVSCGRINLRLRKPGGL